MNYLQPHRSECNALPKGWIREEYPRASGGISSRKSDVYYVSPSGKRVRSKPELLKVLGSDRYDLTAFDFQTGKINPHLLRNATAAAAASQHHPGYSGGGGSHHMSAGGGGGKQSHAGSGKGINGRGSSGMGGGGGGVAGGGGGGGASAAERGGSYDFARGAKTDDSLVLPIRQTASIFKQPVTVHKVAPKDATASAHQTNTNNSGSNNKKSSSSSALDKPRQIFWEKRLSGLRPSYPDEEDVYQPFKMPPHFKPVGPGVDTDLLLASISTSIHLGSGTIKGQNAAKMTLDDVSAFIDPDQPLISATSVTQDDVDKQEAKVNATRAKLAKALEALSA